LILVLSGGRKGTAVDPLQTNRWVPGRQSWSSTLPVALDAVNCGGPPAAAGARQSLPRVPSPQATPRLQAGNRAGRYRQQPRVSKDV